MSKGGRVSYTYVLHLYRRGQWEENARLLMPYRVALPYAKEKCRTVDATAFRLEVNGKIVAEATLGRDGRFSWKIGTNQDSDL